MYKEEVLLEAELLTKFVSGDEDAFELIYQRHKQVIFKFVLKFIHHKELAEDLTQEIFIKLWEARERLSEVQSLQAYLLTIARNHCLDALKKLSNSPNTQGFLFALVDAKHTAVDDYVQNKEYEAYYQRILVSLPNRTREVFKACREEEMSYEAVALALGISRNAVKKHMMIALKRMGSSVKKDLGIPLQVLLLYLMK